MGCFVFGSFAKRCVLTLGVAGFVCGAIGVPPSRSADNFIILQSTTSTQNSGLFEHVLPLFTKETGIEVRVVAVGTGQALKNAQNGDGDVVLVHSEPDEKKFVADGWGVKRYPVMYNDFIIIGPLSDPAKIAGLKDAPEALKRIAASQSPFASRADDSGTHKAELKLWADAGVDPKTSSGAWYLETGSGYGRDLEPSGWQTGLRADGSRHLVVFRQQGWVQGPGRRGSQTFQSIWRHTGQSEQTSERENRERAKPLLIGSRVARDKPQLPPIRSMDSSSFFRMRARSPDPNCSNALGQKQTSCARPR